MAENANVYVIRESKNVCLIFKSLSPLWGFTPDLLPAGERALLLGPNRGIAPDPMIGSYSRACHKAELYSPKDHDSCGHPWIIRS